MTAETAIDPKLDRIDPVASIPFWLMHLSTLLVLVTGFEWKWALWALASYYVRMFFVTIGYHRYFSHRTFKTTRVFQFVLALLAQTSAQKGVLWWAANHRHHHRYSDMENDVHSPARRGFYWAHMGWILSRRYNETKYEAIKDFAKYPELRLLNRHPLMPALLMGVVCAVVGGLPGLVWAFLLPTVVLWHGTFTINSLTHIFGKRRYLTTDNSRNSFILAIVTCGEGWHNNHHFHQNTANQGWFWWEVDFSFYGLKVLSWLRLVSDLRLPSEQTRSCYTKYTELERSRLREQTRFGAWRTAPSREAPVGALPALAGLAAAQS